MGPANFSEESGDCCTGHAACWIDGRNRPPRVVLSRCPIPMVRSVDSVSFSSYDRAPRDAAVPLEFLLPVPSTRRRNALEMRSSVRLRKLALIVITVWSVVFGAPDRTDSAARGLRT